MVIEIEVQSAQGTMFRMNVDTNETIANLMQRFEASVEGILTNEQRISILRRA